MCECAYWPKSFLDEVEKTTVDRGIILWALGGPSFAYRTQETLVWLDPYFSGTPDEVAALGTYRTTAIPVNPSQVSVADIIISTHSHPDHCDEHTLVPMLRHTRAFCVAPRSSAELMHAFGIPDNRIRVVRAGDSLRYRDIEVDVYPSQDIDDPHAVTFVFSSGGTQLFVGGDTLDSPTMMRIGETHRLDLALLAFGRTWYMSEEELISAAGRLSPRTLLPFHWEFWRGHTGDITRLFQVYHRERPSFDIRIMLVGDSLRVV
ncbi:MAG: MBL fold metallo-hydrolase [bacterium]